MKKKFQYSKLLVALSVLISFVGLGIVIYCSIFTGLQEAIACTIITILGGICSTSILFSLKKAQAENTIKLKIGVYQSAADIRLKYNEEMLKLKQTYNATDEDVCEIEMTSDIDEFMDSALSDTVSTVDEAIANSTTEIEKENY